MTKYIKLEELMKFPIRRNHYNKVHGNDFVSGIEMVLEYAKNIPAADVAPVRHGRWEIEMDDMGWLKHTCPNCGYVKRTDIHVSLGWNYCPICGAKMDGGAE